MTLRLLAPADESALAEGLAAQPQPGISHGPLPDTPAALHAHLARLPERLAADEALALAVSERAAGGAFAGMTMLFGHAPAGPSAEVGFWLAPGARGRGLATAALRATLRWALDGLGLERVEALTAPDNQAAQRTLKAADMRTAGRGEGGHERFVIVGAAGPAI